MPISSCNFLYIPTIQQEFTSILYGLHHFPRVSTADVFYTIESFLLYSILPKILHHQVMIISSFCLCNFDTNIQFLQIVRITLVFVTHNFYSLPLIVFCTYTMITTDLQHFSLVMLSNFSYSFVSNCLQNLLFLVKLKDKKNFVNLSVS